MPTEWGVERSGRARRSSAPRSEGSQCAIAALILLNGAPGVGKSTLARRLADGRALALVVEIDALRTGLGQWQQHDHSKTIARDLAVALTRSHLAHGLDVVVPQYIEQVEFIDRLALTAADVGASFVEILITDDVDTVISRFRRRRTGRDAGAPHPESDLADVDVAATVSGACERLVASARERGVTAISLAAGVDRARDEIMAVLDRHH